MRRRYYTLIEITAVLGIMLIVFGVAAVAIGKKSNAPSADASALVLRAFAAECRRSAVIQGKTFTVEFDPSSSGLSFEKKQIFLDDELKIIINGAALESKKPLFTFFPDGSASGLELELQSHDDNVRITVSPLTGMISIGDIEQ